MKHTSQDPSGQASNRKKAARAIQKRLTSAESQVKALFRAIPRTRSSQVVITNATKVIYGYDLSTIGAIGLQTDIRSVLNTELNTFAPIQPPASWWYEPLIELPYRQGTLEEVRDLTQLVESAGIAAIGSLPILVSDPADVLLSSDYLARIRSVTVRNYGLIKTLSDQTADQVIRVINDGVQAGNTPSEIRDAIIERFDVSRSNAQRIADTEVNKAYNFARLDAAEEASNRSGFRTGVMHISALIPTTRQSHASRHSKIFSQSDQRKWWLSGANVINCLCSTRAVLVDNNGKVIDSSLQKEIKNTGDEFFSKQ